MAGLVAAARARQLGVDVRVLEKGDRAGGSMLLSSGVIWRYRDFEEFRRQCPGGDPSLQRLVWERLDDALDWLERLGAPVVERDTERPFTTGRRFEPRGLTGALVRAAGDARARRGRASRGAADRRHRRLPGPACPGTRVARPLQSVERRWRHRLRAGAAVRTPRPAASSTAGRCPVPSPRGSSSPPPSSTAASRAAVNDLGEEFFPGEPSWSENDLAQAIAAQPGGRAWYELDAAALERPEVADRIPFAQETEPLPGGGLRVRVCAAVTHTYGGVKVDERARAADGVWVAGVDAGGISNGGYASGLAQALVLGLVAAEDAAQ